MNAVHFGAGNIGRGFIGLLLEQAGYHITFIDVNQQLIEEINKRQSYNVHFADDTSESQTVRQISAVNSKEDPLLVTQAIEEAAIITTAVGASVLPMIAKTIAEGLQQRIHTNKTPLSIIACENMIGGSSKLKEMVYQEITQDEKATFDRLYHFPDAAVDRIVPNQTNDHILDVTVEPYYEWVVDRSAIKGPVPRIEAIHYVEDLGPYIERKLFTVNTGHAVIAYVGYSKGYTTIMEALKDRSILQTVRGALEESGQALTEIYGFDHHQHQAYMEKIIERFQNPYLSDAIIRVARGPIRKLGPNDRLVKPALMYLDTTGKLPYHLVTAIAASLTFYNEADEEAVHLQDMIKKQGVVATFAEMSKLSLTHPLTEAVMEQYQ
ncbi:MULTISPECIES: mannitol-1-phosphate 5-dehydrogenase [Gracilibacillus]|uniref:mannitol-1-phosphate 5-dehydrogenase n=1 Tax=Gracilibacillus TaxID=74385 RepID=UPI0008270EEC|nr:MULTISPECIES: mannitol-1-phosphate 5-dehydrogenase [Gracilibacillus]